MKETDVLISFQHRSGENENDVYVLTSKKESKKSDKALIKEAFWGVANFDKSMNEYWISDTDVASVESKDESKRFIRNTINNRKKKSTLRYERRFKSAFFSIERRIY